MKPREVRQREARQLIWWAIGAFILLLVLWAMESVGFIQGFLLGILASGIAWRFSERYRPTFLEIVVDLGRAQGQTPGNQPHEFYHVQVRNIPHNWPWPSRRPAWACRARRLTFSWRMKPVHSLLTFRLAGLRNQNRCSPLFHKGKWAISRTLHESCKHAKIDVHGHPTGESPVERRELPCLRPHYLTMVSMRGPTHSEGCAGPPWAPRMHRARGRGDALCLAFFRQLIAIRHPLQQIPDLAP